MARNGTIRYGVYSADSPFNGFNGTRYIVKANGYTVYAGNYHAAAHGTYTSYVEMSQAGIGKAAHSDVTLLIDGSASMSYHYHTERR